MSAKILLVDSDPATLIWLKTKLESEGLGVITANSGREAIPQIEEDAPDVVVLETDLPDMDGLELLRRVCQDPHSNPPWMVVLSKKVSPQDIAAGYEAGADDYLGKRPGADAELVGKIHGHLAQARRPTPVIAPVAKIGHILSFCSSKGGTGTTSICVNTAFALAQLEPDARILVVDMVFPLGTVGLSLGFEPRRTVARLTQESSVSIDRVLIEKYVSAPLKWGFRVLIGATDPLEATSLDASRILPLFETLQTMYDYILVDFGRALSRISMPIIEMSDCAVLIVSPDISTVKAAKLMLNYFASREMPSDRFFVINNRTVGRVWTTSEDIERELKIKVGATVPYVVEYMTMAINAAVPFMERFPDHAASAMFKQIAQTLRDRVKLRN